MEIRLKSILTILFLFTIQTYAANEQKVFNAIGLQSLQVENISGNVDVSVSRDGKAYVIAKKVNFSHRCVMDVKRIAAKLLIRVWSRNNRNSNDCKVHFSIRVPAVIALQLKNISGNIDVTGTKGRVDLNLMSGSARVNARVTWLKAKLLSGVIAVTGLSGSASIETESGGVNLSYASKSNAGLLSIKTGSGSINVYSAGKNTVLKTNSGNIQLAYSVVSQFGKLSINSISGNSIIKFPAAMSIVSKFRSVSGGINNQLGDTPGASFIVTVASVSGNVNLKNTF